MLETAKMA